MRGIVRQERMIEMYMEHQNFWDMRRWLLAGEYFDATPVGNNIMTNDFEEFCTPTPLDGRVVAGEILLISHETSHLHEII